MTDRDTRWGLHGRLALIAGASRGIGYAAARELAGFGADLLLVARDGNHLESVRAELADEFPACKVLAFSADLTVHDQRLEVFDWIADLEASPSLLVNNVGGNVTRAALDYAAEELRDVFETNVHAAFELCRLAHPHLAEHGQAAIVNVGSVSGMVHVRTGAPYGMAKAALHQMSRNLACEWAADGIRVNAVAPWYIRTRRTEGVLADDDYLDEVLARTPLARIGEPEDVAAAIAFLCLPAAAHITGECIAVDGGFLRYGF